MNRCDFIIFYVLLLKCLMKYTMCISFLCDISFSISLVQPECRSHKCWTTEGWPDADQATKILTGSKLNHDDEMSYDAMMRML